MEIGMTRAVEGQARSATAWAWYGLAVLLMTTLFAFVVRQMLSLIAPSLQASLGFSDLQLGMLQGLGMAIFASIASYPMGWLADRFGRRLLLALGVACWSLATALFAFQDSFGGLFAATIGIAIGEAGLAPIVFALIPDLFPERQRNTANFIFYGGSLLGAGLGMALGGVLLQWLAGAHGAFPGWLADIDSWRLAMMLIALPGPVFFLLVLTMPLGSRGSAAGTPAGTDEAGARDFIPYATAHWRTLACIFGSIFAMAVAMTSGLMWFPLALPRAFGIDPATVGVGLGTAITIATLVGVVLAPLTLRLRRADAGLGPVRAAAIFVALTPLPAALLPFTTSAFQAYALAAVQGALGIAASSLMPGVLQNLAPPHLRSRVLALLGIVNALALAASPLVVGWISGLIEEPRGMLYAITIVSLPSLIVSAILMAFAPGPYAATLRAIRPELSKEFS
ncbi:putative Major facilitator superfamily (MFS_1) transporter [uncultured Sphingopyxis sp.]|uniref:Putative Major facilitator superfamily (MFS_1) transporter n=1 Tax=uncultured Sphingopyxis sp. TaxID=310581 RepID=A0A1Y5PW79_9SPHN|nr:MFS transporter [uncultured Sphingopyxis sp.]SBV34272.1 putative Major facilitator superfamily (MFS_1) transporter [uncultured Sphingopyxis sp.]